MENFRHPMSPSSPPRLLALVCLGSYRPPASGKFENKRAKKKKKKKDEIPSLSSLHPSHEIREEVTSELLLEDYHGGVMSRIPGRSVM